MTGSRQEAWRRLQSPVSVSEIREKHEEEPLGTQKSLEARLRFLELHPFKPQTKAAESPRMPREALKVDGFWES